jgi:hypothetical protein
VNTPSRSNPGHQLHRQLVELPGELPAHLQRHDPHVRIRAGITGRAQPGHTTGQRLVRLGERAAVRHGFYYPCRV